MEDKKFWSISEIAQETGYSRQWILDLCRKFEIKYQLNPVGETGTKYEYMVPTEEAKKLIRYAKERKRTDEKRKAAQKAA
jgi:AraC-like DNA-binding protein